jgi:membrane complex biogenesis BtpA family protein
MDLFMRRATPALIGVLHLPPLPGAPRRGPALDEVIRVAVADARALVAGGADGAIVENFGDAPFTAGRVDAVTVAAMTRVVVAVREAAPELLIGVNVLRNDPISGLGVLIAADAHFLRVNVLSGAMVTDQGVITGCARELMLERSRFGVEAPVAADVLVKHAAPLGPISLEDAARDTFLRADAAALIITGAGTGIGIDPEHLDRARAAVPQAPIWIGSGLDPARAVSWRGRYDAAIVGTWLHREGDVRAPLDPDRVRELRRAMTGER